MSMKLLAAAVVLIVGFALGSLFPKDESESPGSLSSTSGVALRRVEPGGAGVTTSSAGSGSSASMISIEPSENRLGPWPDALVATRGSAPDPLREPPPLPVEYAPLAAEPTGQTNTWKSGGTPRARVADARRRDPTPSRVVHQVVDGDTLAQLALDYLGDATLGHQIAEANGGAVADPLMVGIELEIPQKMRRAAPQLATQRPDDAQTRLVPVEPAQTIAAEQR
jgi:hypothetical protein